MTVKQGRMAACQLLFCIGIMITPMLLGGCGHFQARSSFEEANALFSHGNYPASLDKYEQIMKEYPATGDRVLFEMGVIHAYPKNEHKEYQKSLDCFQQLLKDYPESAYRQDSERMIFYISNATVKDEMIAVQRAQLAAQQTRLASLQHELEIKGKEISTLQAELAALEQKFFALATRKEPVDKILIEKKDRRLRLIAKGEVLKTYRIALGGNPEGPKERQGDNKTPEGTYVIDSRNKDSRYHLSLHISYPNEKDKKRARELGVAPGGNVMIHGLKKGFSWVGDAHTEVDWTKGCIAVTDEEIEEIARVTPNGTVVEIRP